MATTRDVMSRPRLTWVQTQKPNTLILFKGSEHLILKEDCLHQSLHRHDRRGGVATYREAAELRICAWPKPGEPQALLEKRNVAAMDMLDLAYRLFSR